MFNFRIMDNNTKSQKKEEASNSPNSFPVHFMLVVSPCLCLLPAVRSDIGRAGLGICLLRSGGVDDPASLDPGLSNGPGCLPRAGDVRRSVLLVLGPHAQQVCIVYLTCFRFATNCSRAR